MYNNCEGINWERYQLVDILLPALLAMDTFTSENGSVEVRWLRRDTAHGMWYHVLSTAMADVVIDVARLLTDQSFMH